MLDADTAYCELLLRRLESAPDALRDLLLRRWEGNDGPSLSDAPAWGALLARAWRESPAPLRPLWCRTLLGVLEGFDHTTLLGLDLPRRLHLLGALELALVLDWGEEKMRIEALIADWLTLARDPRFPAPRELYAEEGIAGVPESDPLRPILRLAGRHLAWSDIADRHWTDAVAGAEVTPAVAAGRAWELAHWAMTTGKIPWLGRRMGELYQVLQRADDYPGNLSFFFFQAEMKVGEERLKAVLRKLAPSVWHTHDGDLRRTLAELLDYFGIAAPAVRRTLQKATRDKVQWIKRDPGISRSVTSFPPTTAPTVSPTRH